MDGETLVESYLLVTPSRYGPARSGTSAASRETGLRTYQMFGVGSEYKIFVRNEGTAWAWRSGTTFYTAMGEAMRSCQDRSREVGQPALCHVHATGDEVVWETFKGWDKSTNFVENTEQSRQWARDNWHSISTKKAEYLHKWAAKSPAEKAEVTLTVNDGI